MSHERRQDPRAGAINLVRISRTRLPGRVDGQTSDLLGRTLDMSLSGMRIELDRWLPPRSVVDCQLALGNQILELRGRVCHTQRRDAWRCGLGIQFESVDADTYEALLEHVALRQAH